MGPLLPPSASPGAAFARAVEDRRSVPLRQALTPIAIGAGLALVLALAPPLRFMGWLLRSLFHETGHVVVAWLGGCPAFPAISLQGHAAAFHQDHRTAVSLLVGAVVVGLAVAAWRGGRFRIAALGLAGCWLLVTLSRDVREMAFLLGGHLGELAFGSVFLRRALTGEAAEEPGERPLYAALGWYLVASNVVLSGGLLFSESARARYASNGSFGLENDYLRVARELPLGLSGISVVMILLSVAVAALALRGRLVRSPSPR